MKKFMLLSMVLTASILFAESIIKVPIKDPDKKQRAGRRLTPEMKAKLLERTGGMVVVRSKGPHFAFINVQKRVPLEELKLTPATIERVLNYPIIMGEGEVKNVMAEAKDFIDETTPACVLIADDAALPSLVIVPESKFAIVNTAALASDSPAANTLASRTRKEMWRAFAYVMGAANSSLNGCLMQTITSNIDLDRVPTETICPEPFQKISATAEKFGMQRNLRGTYRKACLEGWAPPPQTDMQRKIVEEVKAQKDKEAVEKTSK